MTRRSYFFCGIGGSGMLPLALYLHSGGHEIAGSDRAIDQGRADHVARRLRERGISLFPQDGSGVQRSEQILVTSSAVEAEIPDVAAARARGLTQMIRAQLLAETCNAATVSIGVAGTSGKSTTTAMIAHILTRAGSDPSVVNGAPMLNNLDAEGVPQAWRRGEGPFVCEVDESDGSIALYNPSVGVLLNVSEDHKPMDELERLFGGFARRSGRIVLGVDSEPVAALAKLIARDRVVTVSQHGHADFSAREITRDGGRLTAEVSGPNGEEATLRLPLIGAFNVGNALAAIAATSLVGVSLADAVHALTDFRGSARRLQAIGQARGVAVIDDFAHNPDKIGASIEALAHHFKKLLILYQPHGYGPLATFRPLYEEAFVKSLRPVDRLFVSAPAYFGGTVTKTDDAEKLVATVAAGGRAASYLANREDFLGHLPDAGEGDAVVIMGARDDSLTGLAERALSRIEAN